MQEILEQACYIIVTGCATALVSLVCAFINAKINELTDNKYIEGASQVVTDAVKTITQTYVDNIKKDGKFSEEAQQEAKKKAIEVAHTLITVNAQNAIQSLYGDFDKWLDNKIESAIYTNKEATK
jgi:Na+-translocating ferredoxin:NAD+ oxidoreductase RnfG subunit